MTTQIQEYSTTDAALIDLRQRMSKAVYEVNTAKGMEAAKKDRAEVRGYRVALEKMRVELKAPALERSRLIDAEAKRITAELEALEQPIDEQIKKEEQRKEAERLAKIKAEADRIENIREMIAELFADQVVANSSRDSLAIDAAIEGITAIVITPAFMELADEAKKSKSVTLALLSELRDAAFVREQEAARLKAERQELDRLRAADALRAAAERAESDRVAAAERQRLAGERAAFEKQQAVAKAERDRIADEEAGLLAAERAAFAKQQAALKAEQDRIAAVEAKRLADERAAFAKQQADAKAESDRIAAEQKAEREAIDRAKAPLVRVVDFVPTAEQIYAVVAERFGVSEERAASWLERLFSKELADV